MIKKPLRKLLVADGHASILGPEQPEWLHIPCVLLRCCAGSWRLAHPVRFPVHPQTAWRWPLQIQHYRCSLPIAIPDHLRWQRIMFFARLNKNIFKKLEITFVKNWQHLWNNINCHKTNLHFSFSLQKAKIRITGKTLKMEPNIGEFKSNNLRLI